MQLQSAATNTTRKSGSDTIDAFLLILKDGIKSWQTAGMMLVEMRKQNPGIYSEIIRREPMMTVDTLETIERIGLKKLHPRLLLNSQLPVKRLIGFPYEEQGRLCSEPIDVVVCIKSGNPIVSKKLIQECSRKELFAALDTNRVRTVDEQVKLRKQNEGNELWKSLSRKSKLPQLPTDQHKAVVATTIPQSNISVIGRWAVRKTIGNNCGFERTNANPPIKTQVFLDGDGISVIEVCQRISK